MFRQIIFLIIFGFFLQASTPVAYGANCKTDADCPQGYSCQSDPKNPDDRSLDFCQKDDFKGNFGTIKPPDPLKGLISRDRTGAGGISAFLSNLVALFYMVAAIVLIFMILWGAFEWMTSGGDKEKVASARSRIISAIIGMALFAIAYAIIQVLGQFTGFKFFN